MFGMGFTEILIIAVIAILFLGPDKLPSAMVEVAKFFRSMKNTIGTMKSSIEEEMHVADIKQEALAYKEQLDRAANSVSSSNINAQIDNMLDSGLEEEPKKKASTEPEEVTFKKKKKKPEQEENIDV